MYFRVNKEIVRYEVEDCGEEFKLCVTELEYKLLCKYNANQVFPGIFVNQSNGKEYKFFDCIEQIVIDAIAVVGIYRLEEQCKGI
jgi:uncharacterized membrane protein